MVAMGALREEARSTRMMSLNRSIESAACRLRAALLAAALSLTCATLHAQATLPVETIRLPPGFSIEVLARVPNARAMTWGAAGTLFVGSAPEGKVYAVTLPSSGASGQAVST